MNNKSIITFVLCLYCFFSVNAEERPRTDSTLINMETINSPEDDYLPLMVDKRVMMFTSTRKNTDETKSTEHTEKVYWTRQQGKKKWTAPQKNGYSWHSDNNTALVGATNKFFFFYRAYWKGNGEIFYAARKGKNRNIWKADRLRKLTAICSEHDENSITAGIGDTLFFSSNRRGNYDIFMLTQGNIITAIDTLNTEYNETDLYFNPSTRCLYFSSDRPDGAGGYDIYQSSLNSSGQVSPPVRLTTMLINTQWDERDYFPCTDSLIYFASNRDGGLGGYDIYQLETKTNKPETRDTIVKTEEEEHIESQKEQLYRQLDELGLLPFRGEVQIGAYRFIKSLADFYKRFPCISHENIRMDKIEVDKMTVHKYIIDSVYTDVDAAVDKQIEIERLHCLPEELFSDMPFIGILDKNGNRFAIFWKKEEFMNDNIFHIFKNGKLIWKSRRF